MTTQIQEQVIDLRNTSEKQAAYIAKLEEAIMAIHIDKEPYANVKSAILDAQKLVTK